NNTRRIAGSARQGDFMGSDLSYEDMEALGTTGFSSDYDVELLAETDFEGEEAYHLELLPVTDDSSYNKLEIIVSAEKWLPLEIKYFEEGEHAKTLLTSDHDQIDGRWTAQMLEISDHNQDSQTRLILNEVDYNTEIDPGIFTTRNLERGI
ncbi:MAG: outer membrane lipoprotein-sorting protein, partial [Halarsenatibacteraceae bacterium]